MKTIVLPKGGRNGWEQLVPEMLCKELILGNHSRSCFQIGIAYFHNGGQTFRLVLNKFVRVCSRNNSQCF